jgi:hypothetical protein
MREHLGESFIDKNKLEFYGKLISPSFFTMRRRRGSIPPASDLFV